MRKLTCFIAASIDGFIGDTSGDAEFFTRFVDAEFLEFLKTEYPETLPTHGRRALGLDDLENRRFDTVIQGRASYDLALDIGVTSPYAHMRQYVASRTIKDSPDPVVLGSGMPMFASGFHITDFAFESVRAFGNGTLVRRYARKR